MSEIVNTMDNRIMAAYGEINCGVNPDYVRQNTAVAIRFARWRHGSAYLNPYFGRRMLNGAYNDVTQCLPAPLIARWMSRTEQSTQDGE